VVLGPPLSCVMYAMDLDASTVSPTGRVTVQTCGESRS
jgi:hypothetical protein